MTTPHSSILVTHGTDTFAREQAIARCDVKTIHKLSKANNYGYETKI